MAVSSDLLAKYKLSIGDFTGADLDNYYLTFLESAIADLATDDISAEQLESDLGQSLTCIYARSLMDNKDTASDKTIDLLKNKLSILTKGDRSDVE